MGGGAPYTFTLRGTDLYCGDRLVGRDAVIVTAPPGRAALFYSPVGISAQTYRIYHEMPRAMLRIETPRARHPKRMPPRTA
jgi:hypothetical protein